jgi:hypothetical protein
MKCLKKVTLFNSKFQIVVLFINVQVLSEKDKAQVSVLHAKEETPLMLQKPPLSPVLLKVSYDQGGRDLQ